MFLQPSMKGATKTGGYGSKASPRTPMAQSKAPKGDRGTVESPNLGEKRKEASAKGEDNLKTLTKKYMGASNFLKEFYRMQDEVCHAIRASLTADRHAGFSCAQAAKVIQREWRGRRNQDAK